MATRPMCKIPTLPQGGAIADGRLAIAGHYGNRTTQGDARYGPYRWWLVEQALAGRPVHARFALQIARLRIVVE